VTPARSGGTVLLVEDDDSMRAALERLLNAFGFRCIAFPSAETLLASGVGEGAVCLVSDLKLPGMSGLDLLAELRTRRTPLPSIVITSHDAPGLRDGAGRQGVSAYLTKPFPGIALLDAIKAAIKPVVAP
jgi:FixJ family two-component response regulator